MDTQQNLLITLLNGDFNTLQVAIKIKNPDESLLFWAEPDIQKKLLELLPEYCRTGHIIKVEEIFAVINE